MCHIHLCRGVVIQSHGQILGRFHGRGCSIHIICAFFEFEEPDQRGPPTLGLWRGPLRWLQEQKLTTSIGNLGLHDRFQGRWSCPLSHQLGSRLVAKLQQPHSHRYLELSEISHLFHVYVLLSSGSYGLLSYSPIIYRFPILLILLICVWLYDFSYSRDKLTFSFDLDQGQLRLKRWLVFLERRWLDQNLLGIGSSKSWWMFFHLAIWGSLRALWA
mgnify:CR=1 FL=1